MQAVGPAARSCDDPPHASCVADEDARQLGGTTDTIVAPAEAAATRAPAPRRRTGRGRAAGAVSSLVVALVGIATLGVSIGSVRLPVTEVWSTVGERLGLPVDGPGGSTETIVWVVRVPRVLLAALVGAGLAVVGSTLQAALRNPIADPYLLGISSGASVGAVAVIAFGAGAGLGVWALSGAAFAGALTTAAAVLLLATRRTATSLRIVLTGTAVAYTASAISSFLIYRAPNADAVRAVVFWLLGSLAGASWAKLVPAALAVGLGTIVLWARGRDLDALLLGDDTAAALGVDVGRLRLQLVVLTSLVTATVVAVSGAIGFVGLLLPHGARLLVGHDHRRTIPVTALAGAAFLVAVDLVARTVASPEEVPVGIITAGLGAPFFLWMLNRRDAREVGYG